MAVNVGTEPCQPRTVKRQQHRSNIQVDAVFDHYKINIAIPFLDHVISDLDAQFSRKFVKHNFRHIGWISINSLSMYCYFHVYYRYIHLYSTGYYCCIVVFTQQVDLTEVVCMYEHDLPSPECVYQELSRWKQRYVLRSIYGIYGHFTIQIFDIPVRSWQQHPDQQHLQQQ